LSALSSPSTDSAGPPVPSLTGRRPLLLGLSAGTLALGLDYLGHALVGLPLVAEQAGYLLLKVLPLPVFAGLLSAFGILARPLLLMGATVVIIVAYGIATLIVARIVPRGYLPVLTGLVALVTLGVAMVARSAGDSALSLAIEVVLLAGMVPVVDLAMARLAAAAAVDDDRRMLLRNLLYGAVGIAVLGIGYATVRRFATALALTEGSRATSEITDVKDFYVVSKNLGGDPVVEASSWRLSLPTRSLTYQELLALPSRELELTLSCISNEVGGTLISNGRWRGPQVSDVLALTPRAADAAWMLMESADGYTESFPLSELTPDHLLATHLNGAPLSSPHGFPTRFIFPGRYGMKQPKWVTRIRLAASDQPGYWENNGWDKRAIVKTMSRIDQPVDGAALPAGTVRFTGIAFAGSRRINQVELSWDAGHVWHGASLRAEFSPFAWRFWQLETSLPAGHYRVRVRATDGDGTLQTSRPSNTLPNGADGHHTITLDLA
jgi:DMSO/TMAO reductase YedYZ molybdopterin-dependent catalytic subunit